MSAEFRDGVLATVPSMRAYALVMTRSSVDADDLVQDALVRAWRYRGTYVEGTNLKAWLFRILRNEFFAQGKRKPRGQRSLEEIDEQYASRAPEQEWSRLYGEMLNGLERLSHSNRDALLLVGGAGFSYDEAAAVIGCPAGTVKSRVSRAREQLADMLDYELPERRRPDVQRRGRSVSPSHVSQSIALAW